MGGTIASVRTGANLGAEAILTAADIAASVDGLGDVADVHAEQFLQAPSPSITFDDLLRLRDEMRDRVAAGARGIVVTQGTDTLEETAFVLDLLWDGEAPVVFSGAMRNPSLPGADGPANLLAAVQVAASDASRGLGVLVVMNDEIHAARFVRKMHTSNPSTFRSDPTGPIGWVSEGRVSIVTHPVGRSSMPVRGDAHIPPVALIRLSLSDDGRLLSALDELGYEGAVIEAMGGGHVPTAAVPFIEKLIQRMPIVLASRTGSGEVLRETYRFPGSEIALLELGLIRAGALDGLKARLLLSLCLARGDSRDRIAQTFARFGTPAG